MTLLDTREVAALLHCTPGAVTRLVARGSGPAVYGHGARGVLLFRPEDVDAWVRDPVAVRLALVRSESLSYTGRQRVYLIRDPSNFVKIGSARDPEQRLREIQCGNPRTLSLCATIRGDRGVEIMLHEAFAVHRERGEWFRDVPEIEELFWSIKRE